MADNDANYQERTEQPTAKRLEKARERGEQFRHLVILPILRSRDSLPAGSHNLRPHT